MSNITRAVIIQSKFHDLECVFEALEQMGVRYSRVGTQNNYRVDIPEYYLRFECRGNTVYAVYDTENTRAKQFIYEFMKVYKKVLDEKLERLHLEELKLHEQQVLAEIAKQEELRRRAQKIKRRRLQLEKARKREEIEMRREIEQKKKIIVERAKRLGYDIREEVHGNEIVLVLVRRRQVHR